MPNKNYLKGRRFEYKVKQLYEGNGYLVVRAAGSKSPFDLIALRDNNKPLLIQCKTTKSDKTALDLREKFMAFPPMMPCKDYLQMIHIKIGKNPTWVTGLK